MFSCHIVDNPDQLSEIELLRSYAPEVPDHTLHQLTSIFADLRRAVDDGTLAYPYSTRELVNIVRHLQKYPSDGAAATTDNVLAFDNHSHLALQILRQIFHKHGLPIVDRSRKRGVARLARAQPLAEAQLAATWYAEGGALVTPVAQGSLRSQAVEVFFPPPARVELLLAHR